MPPESPSHRPLFECATPWLLIAFALACYYLLVDSPGTPDVPDYWVRWIGLMRQHGIVSGYAVAGSDYLPGTFALLAITDCVARAIAWDVAFQLKGVIAMFAIASGALFGLWKRSPHHAGALLIAVLLSSAAHGYLDALYLPALLGALWSLGSGRQFTAGLLFGTALCFKWQPILVAPFAVAFVLRRQGNRPLSIASREAGTLLLGIALPFTVQVAVFGLTPVLQSLRVATHHPALSLQGLNLNWVVQMAINQARGFTGPLYDLAPPPALAFAMKSLFLLTYAGVLLAQWMRGRSFAHFLWGALAGSFAYFALNTGVHENHLFVTMVLAFCLLGTGAGASWIAAYTTLSLNVNLLLFYGLQGRTPLTSAHTNTAAVVLSLTNTAVFVLCCAEAIRLLRRGVPIVAAAEEPQWVPTRG